MTATYPRQLIDAIARRHGLTGEPVLLSGGMINEAWRIDGHVLRIAREAGFDDEAAREALIAPLVAAAGVRAPRLVAADLERSISPRPYTIYQHAPGVLLGSLPPDPVRFAPLLRALGGELARIAEIPIDETVRAGLHDRKFDPRRRLAIAVERGALDATSAGELAAWLDAQAPRLGPPRAPVFLHNDIHPWNLLVDPAHDELVAIIDWGDAGYADPALELVSMAHFTLPAIVEGYRAAGGPVDDDFLRRVAWLGASLALWEIVELDAAEFDRRWWRMPPGGWPELRRCLDQLAGS
jgi:aminoglycoside phosphotransferase (APT) family kinase protein